MQFPTMKASNCDIYPTHDKIIYHKKFMVFPQVPQYSLGNKFLVDEMPYRCFQNLPFNAINVEFYKLAKEKENDLLGTILLYFKLFHYSRFSVPTFVKKIPLVILKVSKTIMSISRCCLKKAPWNVTLVFIEIG